jgi:SAM-dependent methyltransferase
MSAVRERLALAEDDPVAGTAAAAPRLDAVEEGPTVAGVLGRLRGYGARQRLAWARHVLSEYASDWLLGIETIRRVPDLRALGVEGGGNKGYSPIAYRAFRAVLARVEVAAPDVFVDLGAGKGRVLALAARLPFRRVVGVEIAPQLAAACRRNLARARGLRAGAVEVVTADASGYELPDDTTVLHLANPFQGEVLEAVIERLRASLERRPRRLTLLYANPYLFEPLARDLAWIRRRLDVPYPFAERRGPDISLYRVYDAGA